MLLIGTVHECVKFNHQSALATFKILKKIGASGAAIIYGSCGIAEDENSGDTESWPTTTFVVEIPDNLLTHSYDSKWITMQLQPGYSVKFCKLPYRTLQREDGYSGQWSIISKWDIKTFTEEELV